MKSFIFIVGITLALWPSSTTDGQDWTGTVRRVKDAFVRFEAALPGVTDHGVCTASRVAQGHFIVAAHCLEATATYQIDGRPATVLKSDAFLAMLMTQEPRSGSVLHFRPDAPVGTPVLIGGFAFDSGLKFTFGWVSAYGTWPGMNARMMFVHCPIFPGYSGAAVVGADGRLIGIAQATWAITHSPLALAVPVSTVQKFLTPPTIILEEPRGASS